MPKQLFDEMLYVPRVPPSGEDPVALRRYIYEELSRLGDLISAAVDGDIQGIDTTFVTADGTPKTMTVTNGVITDEA